MASSALDFCAAHPDSDAGYAALVTRLKERIARAGVLEAQESDGQGTEHGARLQRRLLRREVLLRLRHLAQVAALAAETHPELTGLFPVPSRSSANRELLAVATAMLAAAREAQAVLVSLALGESFLDDLGLLLVQFDHATGVAHAAQSGHVGAHAELEALASECGRIVRVLDGFNRTRFAGDAELLAAWRSARSGAGGVARDNGDRAGACGQSVQPGYARHDRHEESSLLAERRLAPRDRLVEELAPLRP